MSTIGIFNTGKIHNGLANALRGTAEKPPVTLLKPGEGQAPYSAPPFSTTAPQFGAYNHLVHNMARGLDPRMFSVPAGTFGGSMGGYGGYGGNMGGYGGYGGSTGNMGGFGRRMGY